jgi:hypothetical protein
LWDLKRGGKEAWFVMEEIQRKRERETVKVKQEIK